jgi:hypothetical protein
MVCLIPLYRPPAEAKHFCRQVHLIVDVQVSLSAYRHQCGMAHVWQVEKEGRLCTHLLHESALILRPFEILVELFNIKRRLPRDTAALAVIRRIAVIHIPQD